MSSLLSCRNTSCGLLLWLLALAAAADAVCDCALTQRRGATSLCSGCDRLPDAVASGVSRLVLTGNRVSRVDLRGASPSVARLAVLYLGHNRISSLRAHDTCPLEMLTVLDVSDNNLEVVEDQSLECNHHLRRLVLSDNPRLQLGALSSRSLTHLFLERCGLSALGARQLRGLPGLRHLYLSGNPALRCAHVTAELQRHLPQLRVHCGDAVATTTTPSSPTPASNPHVPDNIVPNVSPNNSVIDQQVMLPAPLVVLLVILVIVLVGTILSASYVLLAKRKPAVERVIDHAEGRPLRDIH